MRASLPLLFKKVLENYFFALAMSAAFSASKAYFISKAVGASAFAEYSYFALAVGFGSIFAGAGVVLRCHAELPAILQKKQGGRQFLRQSRGWVLLASLAYGACLSILGGIQGWPAGLILLSGLQAMLYLVFTFDLIVLKSRGQFSVYASLLMRRNLVLFLGAIASAFLTGHALYVMLVETLLNLVLGIRQLHRWKKGFSVPSKAYLQKTLLFVPVAMIGAFSQFSDKIVLSQIFSKADFAVYSYFSLVVVVGTTLQQFLNTRAIVVFSRKGEDLPALWRDYRQVVLRAGQFGLAALPAVGSFLTLDSVKPKWLTVDLEYMACIVAIAFFRLIDFSQSALVCMHRKKSALSLQVMFVLLLVGGALLLSSSAVVISAHGLILVAALAVWSALSCLAGSSAVYFYCNK